MKKLALSVTVTALLAAPLVHADRSQPPSQRPCFNVEIQNDRINDAGVQQNCNMNISRIVQAGKRNSASTVQTGDINNNKVRQYEYTPFRYNERLRRRAPYGD